ncbi:glycosyltransferase [Oceanobacillus massiliensis]|uniref:glycosyltransferase n=1 Tax=Oceanobacillus massiliensis TaxID=1465765 RepID=UPI0002882D2D|nr:glycosyltransferase [Oceanobacillus massiliensis]
MGKRVLFISDHGDPLAKLGGEQAGGQNNYVKQLALALDDIGIKVDVITHWSNPEAPMKENFGQKCRVIRIAAGHKGYMPKNKMYRILPAFYQEIKNKIDLKSYDIVHSHYWLSGLLGLYVKEEYNLPLVHTSHSLGIAKIEANVKAEKRRLRAEKMILQGADRVIATTQTEKELIFKFAGNDVNVEVSSIGVDPVFQPYIKRKQTAAPTFAFAGRLEKTKGIYTLLEAFKRLHKTSKRMPKLIIAGGDEEAVDLNKKLPLKSDLREMVKGMEGKIEFIGPQTQEDLAELFNKATSVIVPSYYESFGMVAAEAQACGTPVIASDVGGLKNVVSDGETGLLTEPKDPIELSMAIHELANHSLLVKRLGSQASKRAKKYFNWKEIAQQLNKTYEVLKHVSSSHAHVGD